MFLTPEKFNRFLQIEGKNMSITKYDEIKLPLYDELFEISYFKISPRFFEYLVQL